MSADSRGLAGSSGEGDGQPPAPTCYRHRNRETWLRCSRCDRPICPDCMHEAAVGFHCPECVRSGNRSVRQARTVFGGRVRASSGVVAWTLIGINVAFYIGELLVQDAGLVLRLGTVPAEVASGEWWRLVTGAFLHAPYSFFHILVNMWALFVLGPPLEALLGRLRFATLYLLSALGGSALIYLVGPVYRPSIGASGAIFGLFGATFVVARRLNLDTRWILLVLGVNLVITFTVPSISWQAHLGGLATGAVLALAYAYAPRSSRNVVHVAASAGVFAVIVALNALATLAITTGFG